jgi:hypothetical protein
MPADNDLVHLPPTIIETHPTMNLRFIQRGNEMVVSSHGPVAIPFPRNPRVLQQEWATITFEGNRPVQRETEWRDVPLVVEA